MIELIASKSFLQCTVREVLASGAQKAYRCKFSFTREWEGLTRTACFRADETVYSVPLGTDNTATIPWEVLKTHGIPLYAGVYGTDGGTVVLPTIWSAVGTIHRGVTDGEAGAEPTPGAYAALLAAVGDLSNLSTTEKSSLVAALNELYANGGGSGGASVTGADIDENGHLILTLSTGGTLDAGYCIGKDGVGIASAQQTTSSTTSSGKNVWEFVLTDGTVAEFTVYNGEKGDPGEPGEAGNGIVSIQQTTASTASGGANVWTVTMADGTTSTLTVYNGAKGDPGEKGDPGASAYEIAVANGYTGTEAEWLESLKGSSAEGGAALPDVSGYEDGYILITSGGAWSIADLGNIEDITEEAF